MDENAKRSQPALLAEQFEEHRSRLHAVAYRMLGGHSEAEDAVQDAWLRLSRSDASSIGNVGGWLITAVARVCLDMLRARGSRREEPLDAGIIEAIGAGARGTDHEQELLLAESVSLAMLIVLDRLDPAERLAFVLHDMFAISFDEIASMLGRSPAAARQLASRARRRVQGAPSTPNAGLAEQKQLADAFLAALRAGDFEGLVAVLDPDVVVRMDETTAGRGRPREIRGAREWAKGAIEFARVLRGAIPPLPLSVNGTVALVWAPRGRVSRVLGFSISNGRIATVDLIGDRARIDDLDITALGE